MPATRGLAPLSSAVSAILWFGSTCGAKRVASSSIRGAMLIYTLPASRLPYAQLRCTTCGDANRTGPFGLRALLTGFRQMISERVHRTSQLHFRRPHGRIIFFDNVMRG